MAKAKVPEECHEFRITLYTLKEYMDWTDEDVAKRLGVTVRTVANMRKDPGSVAGCHILKVQALAAAARENYGR